MTQREKIIKKDLRGQICRIISAMLDNPDKYGIYPTTKCYDELEDLLEEQRQEIVEKLKRIKLDMDVAVCDCGEPYRDSDAAVLINELLEELEST